MIFSANLNYGGDDMSPKQYVKAFILSGGTNPTESQFRDAMQQTKNRILNELAKYCDQLKRNFIHAHGPNAPGIKHCERAKRIILSSRG